MPNIPSPAPQKKGVSAPQQDADVMNLIKRGGKSAAPPNIEKAKNDLRRIIKQVGIDPKRIVKAGKMSEQAMKDRKLYPMVIQMAIKENLISPKDVQPGVIDFGLLAKGMTAGRLTEELIKEGSV
jgi:hypothetical protein